MKERILEFLRKENKTSSQFAEEIGVQPSSVSHIISGRNKPSLDFVVKMLQRYDGLNTDWLLFGTGDMYKEQISQDLFAEFDITDDSQVSSPSPQTQHQPSSSPSQSSLTSTSDDPQPSTSPLPSSSSIRQVIIIFEDGTFKALEENVAE